MLKSLLVAQISDLHVVPSGRLAFGAADTGRALSRLIASLSDLNPPLDAIIITGDLADNGERESYEILSKALDSLNRPVLIVPGNHDDRALIEEILSGHILKGPNRGPGLSSMADLEGYRLILMDSVFEGSHSGGLAPEALDWLEEALAPCQARPALVAIHHPPFPSGLGLIDEPFVGSGRLAGIMSRFPGVILCCGHLHLPMATWWKGGQAVVCPSVISMELELGPAGGGAFSLGPPAYLLHHLTPNGVNTHFRQPQGRYPKGGPYLFSGDYSAEARLSAGLPAPSPALHPPPG